MDYARTTNSQGSTSLALRLNPGEYPVTVSCGDTVVNSNVVVLSTINASDIVKMDKNATQYYATFLDGSGKYLADGTTIRFNINGAQQHVAVSGLPPSVQFAVCLIQCIRFPDCGFCRLMSAV